MQNYKLTFGAPRKKKIFKKISDLKTNLENFKQTSKVRQIWVKFEQFFREKLTENSGKILTKYLTILRNVKRKCQYVLVKFWENFIM